MGEAGAATERARVWGVNPTSLTLLHSEAGRNDLTCLSPGFLTREAGQWYHSHGFAVPGM